MNNARITPCYAPLVRKLLAGLVAAFVIVGIAPGVGKAQSPTGQTFLQAELHRAYDLRADSLVAWFAARINPADVTTGGHFDLASALRRVEHTGWVEARLEELLKMPPRGDMFWMYPVVTLMFEGRDRLSPRLMEVLRDQWRTYMPYRGDTENHWVLYYASMFLMSEAYPGEPGESWFTGKSSEENRAEAEEWLKLWMDITTTIGQGEYDSPHYLKVFIGPMAMLYAYARDPEMKLRAQMMLDYIIADFAAESLNGMYGGAHSRVYETEAVEPWLGANTRFAWLLFGVGPFVPSGESLQLALSGYRPPEILHHIALDRSEPYVHRELKRTRHRIRNSDVRNAPVYKYTMMRPEYVLGSSQGGLLQPIQQKTWHLLWAVDDVRGARNTLFTLHPYSSPLEGTMYFAEHWHMVTELIVRSKREFDSPTKWTGGSPYEQVFQHEDVVVALYDIPEGTNFPHITGFFSRDLSTIEVDPSGWIFARGGDALIAYFPFAPYEFVDEDGGDRRLHSPHLRNGAVVQVAPASAHPNFDAFKQAVRGLQIQTSTADGPRVSYRTLGGDLLEVAYGEVPRVNGTAVDYDNWPLFDGPFLQAAPGSRRLEMRHGPVRRTLDFNTLSIETSVDSTGSLNP
jgi:hypothetical protein